MVTQHGFNKVLEIYELKELMLTVNNITELEESLRELLLLIIIGCRRLNVIVVIYI